METDESFIVSHGNANFVSRETFKKPFQSRDQNLVVFNKKPEKSNRKMFSLVYCPENGYCESFEPVQLFEEHVLVGNHKESAEICS